MPTPKIIAFAGSARRDSYHKILVQVAARGAKNAGAEVTFLDFKDYPLPLYCQDLEDEQGIPENGLALKKLFREADGLLVASPEFNSSVTPLLKNVIDWVSRPTEGEPRMAGFQGKVAAVMATSPGALGGVRGLVHIRAILSSIGVLVIPKQRALPHCHSAFDASGDIHDETERATLEAIGQTVAETAAKLIA